MDSNIMVVQPNQEGATPVAPTPVINQNMAQQTETPVIQQEQSNLHEIRQQEGKYFIGNYGGKDRYICFDLNAFAELEDRFGSMEEAQNRLQSGSMKDIRLVMWLGLIWDETVADPETGEPLKYNISPFQVGSWLNTSNLNDVVNKLQAAMTGALPDESALKAAQATQGTGPVAQQVSNPNS